jgi:hypothetical protein
MSRKELVFAMVIASMAPIIVQPCDKVINYFAGIPSKLAGADLEEFEDLRAHYFTCYDCVSCGGKGNYGPGHGHSVDGLCCPTLWEAIFGKQSKD